MPVLGQDPDAPSAVWDDSYRTQRRKMPGNPVVASLVEYFAVHPNLRMSHRMNDNDRGALARFFSRKLASGVTSASLKKMVDAYYQSWGADSDTPAMTFVSNTMQDKLQEHLVLDVSKSSPRLDWVYRGMPDDGTFFDTKGYRKAILMHGAEVVNRYPRVLDDLLGRGLDSDYIADGLETMDNLIRWNLLTPNVSRPPEHKLRFWRTHMDVPEPLLTASPKPHKVAAPKSTFKHALSSDRKKMSKVRKEW